MYLSESDFAKDLEQLLELRASGRAWLLVTSSAVNFVFAADAADDELRQAAKEVSEAVFAVTTNVSPEDFAARRSVGPMQFFGIAEEPEDTDIARRKLDLVMKRFPIDDLKRRRSTRLLTTPSLSDSFASLLGTRVLLPTTRSSSLLPLTRKTLSTSLAALRRLKRV